MGTAAKRTERISQNIKNKNIDAAERTIRLKSGYATVFYIKQLTNTDALSDQVIKPIMQFDGQQTIDARSLVHDIVVASDCLTDSDDNIITDYLLDGMTVVLLSAGSEYAVINLKKVEKRAIPEPEFAFIMRGPRDAFIENLDTNLSLVRYRIKCDKLKIDYFKVGKRNKTKIAVLYIEDIANSNSVGEIKKRIGNIDVDGMSSSGELQAFILNSKYNLFPQVGIVERSDMACGALLEGKIIVLMDGSPWALVAPKVFSEYLWTCDDFYSNKYYGLFARILRLLSLNLSFIVSALYVGIVSFHNDVLPSSYMVAIAEARSKVPFNALTEVLLIEIIGELIRESLMRVPSKIGSAIGIVGAIIIGQAAVSAGIFSPLLLIVISLSLISSFVPADFTLTDPFRLLKFPLILATGFFGFFGFTLVIMIILAQLVSINTFGVPYMAPYAPYNGKDFKKSFFYSKSMATERAGFLRTKDKTRMKPKS